MQCQPNSLMIELCAYTLPTLFTHVSINTELGPISNRQHLPAFAEVVLPTALSVLASHWTEKQDIK